MKKIKGKSRFLYLLLNKRIYIYYFSISFALLFLLYSFVATPKYVSVGQLLPSMSSSASLQFLQGIELGGDRITRIARAAGLSLGATSGDILSAVLQSRSIKERVIQENALAEHYNISAAKIDDVIRALGDATSINLTPEDVVIIEVEDRDPKKAKEVVDSYIAALDIFLRESGMTKGKYERIFLEQRLGEINDSLKVSEDLFVAFQEKHHITHLSEEIRVGIELYARLKAALQAKEIEFKMKSGYLREESPEIVALKQQISAYERELKELETKSDLEGYGIGSSISLKDLSRVELEYYRIYRKVKENEKIYAFLVELYEQAKISEARDTPIVTVLDHGAIPQKPRFPRKLRMTVYGVFIGLLFGIGYILFGHFSEVFLQHPENRDLYEKFRATLANDFRSIKGIFKRR